MSLLDTALEKDSYSYYIKMYIKDDGVPSHSVDPRALPRNPEWVDFTDVFESNGKNLLKSIGQISHKAEGKAGISKFLGSINSIELDNSNGYWNTPIPVNSSFTGYASPDLPAYGNSIPTELNTVNGNIAYFTTSKNFSRTVYEGRLIKIELCLDLQDGTVSRNSIGVFSISGMDLNVNDRTVSMKLESLSMLLKRTEANKVKDGYHWYKEKEFPFLVEKLLEAHYGTLPSTFLINKNIDIENEGDASDDNRLLSHYSRPPGYDGTEWNYNPDPCEALLLYQYNTGTLSSSTDYGDELTFSTALPVVGLRPIIGDIIRIKSGVNEGIYEITDITGAIATVSPNLKGKATSGMDYTITRVYMGIGPELWVWKPEVNEYYQIIDYNYDNVSSSDNSLLHQIIPYGSENKYHRFKIKRLWFNSNNNTIVGAMTTDHVYYLDTGTSNEAKLNSPVVFFKEFYISYSSTNSNNHNYKIRSIPIPDIFTGEFCVREGYNSSFGYVIGNLTSIGVGGENLILPYEQKVIAIPKSHGSSDVAFNYIATVSDIDSDISSTVDVFVQGNEFPRGYHIIQLQNDSKLLRFSLGQKGFIEFHEDGNTNEGVIFLCQMVRTSGTLSYQFNIKCLPINSNLDGSLTALTNGNNIQISSEIVQPISGSINIGDAAIKVYVGLIAWKKTGDVDSDSYICEITGSGTAYTIAGAPSALTPIFTASTSASDTHATPIDFIVDGSTIDMIVLYRNCFNSVNEHTAYDFSHFVVAGSFTSSARAFSGPVKGLVREVVTGDDYYYFHDSGNNVLVYSLIQTTSQDVTIADSGNNPVDNGSFLSSNLIVDVDSRDNKSTPGAVVYGVSASKPMPVDNQYDINVEDFYYLWKYDVNFIPICELADFSDLSVYDALGLIAEATNHIIGYDEEDYFYIPKELYGDPEYVFRNNGDTHRLINSMIHIGVDEVYNYVSITPNSVILEEPSATLGLVERTTIENENSEVVEEKAPDVELVVKQGDKNQKVIKLICTQGAVKKFVSAAEQASGYVMDHKPHFKYINYSNTFETRLGSLFSSGTVIYITSGADSVKTGDIIYFYGFEKQTNVVNSSDVFSNYEDYVYVTSDPTKEDIVDGKINISKNFTAMTAPPNGFQLGTRLVIVKRPGNIWSNEIINLFATSDNTFFENWEGTLEVPTTPYYWSTYNASSPVVSINKVYTFVYGSCSVQLRNSGVNNYIYRSFTAVLNQEYTILAWVKSGSEAYGATVQIGTAGSPYFRQIVYNTNWTLVRGSFVGDGNPTAVYFYCTNRSTNNKIYIDSLIICKGRTGTFPYIPVYTYNHWYPIDDSNVYFMFKNIATDDEKDEEDYKEGYFKTGDYIDIDCPGENLSPDETSPQTALNTASIQAYGRQEYPSIENRFVNFRTAKTLANNILLEYQYPHYNITITSPLVVLLNFISDSNKLAMYGYEDQFSFPMVENYRVDGYLKEFSYDLNNATTSVKMRSKEPY